MKNKFGRYLKKIAYSILLAIAFKLLFFRLPDFFEADLLVIPFIVFLLWEGNIFIDKQLEKKYSWLKNPNQRLITQFAISLIFTALTLFLLMNVMHFTKFNEIRIFNRAIRDMFVPAIVITFLSLIVYISGQFLKAWKQSLLDVEKHKTESALAQLQNLKNQLNPHFLFNNLSVLSSLVYQNQEKAVEFINELSKVYRYVLENKNAELVSFKDELDFLQHYIYLLKIRFEENIIFDIKIEDIENKFLPPMCLQMLVENTFQHNETSSAKPLHVSIINKNNRVVVSNLIQPRSDKAESSQTGLENMKFRFKFFIDEPLEVIKNENIFSVSLPLITQK